MKIFSLTVVFVYILSTSPQTTAITCGDLFKEPILLSKIQELAPKLADHYKIFRENDVVSIEVTVENMIWNQFIRKDVESAGFKQTNTMEPSTYMIIPGLDGSTSTKIIVIISESSKFLSFFEVVKEAEPFLRISNMGAEAFEVGMIHHTRDGQFLRWD